MPATILIDLSACYLIVAPNSLSPTTGLLESNMVSGLFVVKIRLPRNYFYLYFGSKVHQLVYELMIVEGR